MLLSFDWLRELCSVPADARAAASALTARGLTVDALREQDGDTVLDVDVPANRPDCLGHLGIARELSAAFGVPLCPPTPLPASRAAGSVADAARVEIDAADLCGRYTARLVRGVRVAPSPEWVVRRLAACGLHAINNVVDVSNLVLLQSGHPIHTFDFARVSEGRIRVRRATRGETLVTLDGLERRLDETMLVIADARRAVALAGVIGGRDSQIGPETRDVLVEAAWFAPSSVRATARELGIATDASHRFERGADPEGTIRAQDLAVRWLVELCAGTAAEGTIDARGALPAPRRVALRPERVGLLLGYDPTAAEIDSALGALQIPHRTVDARGTIEADAPSWRVDLEREADLVEEVARHLGYDRIPARLPLVGASPSAPDPAHEAAERTRDALSQLGFHEAFCYSMTAAGEDDPFVPAAAPPALALANPIAEPMNALRRSLLPGLVRAADANLRHGARDVRLFEVGGVFLGRAPGSLPDEPLRVGLVWSGAARPRHWSAPAHDVRLPDLSGIVERVLATAGGGVEVVRSEPQALRLAGLAPGTGVEWKLAGADGAPVAWGGALHPDVAAALGVEASLYLAEVDLRPVVAAPAAPFCFRAVPRVPATSRDLSLVVPRALPYASVRHVMERVAPPAPVTFEVTDRYEGPPLPADEISLTVRAILQPLDRTLTDAETESYRGELVEALRRECGIRLRESPAGG